MSVEKSIATENYTSYLFFFFRRRETRSQRANERPVQFDDLQNGYENLGASTSSLVYQNVGDSRRSIEGML